MLLIYVPKLTNRLGYTINVVMHIYVQTEFAITTDLGTFKRHEGPRLCYASQPLAELADQSVRHIYIQSVKLLFQTTKEKQDCGYFTYEHTPALFPTKSEQSVLPFDPFAAVFYMLSRYEEYLPAHRDEHGRFKTTDSIAYRHNFMQVAVVDRWALMLRDRIAAAYPDFAYRKRRFAFETTIDIDAAYCYCHKGFVRTTMGLLRDGLHRHDMDEVKKRIRVLRKKEADPFDTFDYIINTCQALAPNGNLFFFAHVGDYGIYDKPTFYQNTYYRQLLQHLDDHAKIGVHTSYDASEEPQLIEEEIERLSDITHRTIVRNRFHFLRFKLPESYEWLETNGILHDYSMGYADRPGFRCGTCTSFPFFDLNSSQETDLLIHPFAVMDTTLHTHVKMSPEEAIEQYHKLVDEVRTVGGTFSCIFHNQNLGEVQGWQGWRAVFEDFLRYAESK